jgi:carbonic anhydrase/acetyltransferase-like protein (isoleucine patch superfamily)
MLYQHRQRRPQIDPTAEIAPTATIVGDVTIGPHCLIGFGAILVAEGAPITLAEYVVVREQALLRSTLNHPLQVDSHVLIGPRAALYGCHIEAEAFLATGVTIFHGARVGRRAEIRVNGIVHVMTEIPAGSTVPIGWVAVGRPVHILPPEQHERIWEHQEPLNFPKVVYGLTRRPDGTVDMQALTARVYETGRQHREDVLISPSERALSVSGDG